MKQCHNCSRSGAHGDLSKLGSEEVWKVQGQTRSFRKSSSIVVSSGKDSVTGLARPSIDLSQVPGTDRVPRSWWLGVSQKLSASFPKNFGPGLSL